MPKMICDRDKVELKLDILEFAMEHGLRIHPEKDLDGFCERTVGVGHCPCKDHEMYCPCSVALENCKEQGFCTCRLFASAEAYPGMLAKMRARWKRKNEKRHSGPA